MFALLEPDTTSSAFPRSALSCGARLASGAPPVPAPHLVEYSFIFSHPHLECSRRGSAKQGFSAVSVQPVFMLVCVPLVLSHRLFKRTLYHNKIFVLQLL